MISLDTNVLVRILVDDPESPAQNKAARALASHHKQFYISQIVQAELYWVLEKCYEFDKESQLVALGELLTNEAFVLENAKYFDQAVHLYKSHNIDFADVLILTHSKHAQAKFVATFDKKFARLPGVKLVE